MWQANPILRERFCRRPCRANFQRPHVCGPAVVNYLLGKDALICRGPASLDGKPQAFGYSDFVLRERHAPSLGELRTLLQPFCRKYGIRRLDIFGSAARGLAAPDSDVDMLVTL